MKRIIRTQVREPMLAWIPNITYAHAPYWYGTTLRPLMLDLILPKHRQGIPKMPLLIWICGGAFQQMDRHLWLPSMMAYARQGYIVASVDYRVSSQATYPAAVQDVRSAIRFLRAHSDEFAIDPRRIALMGESAGGYLALMAALGDASYDVGEWLEEPSGVQAVIDYYGKADLSVNGADSACNDALARQFMGGALPCEALRQASPVAWVHPAAPPIMILHGDRDQVIPIEESERLYRALVEQGSAAEFYVLEGTGHGADEFFQPDIQAVVMDFLRRAFDGAGEEV